MSGEDWMLLIYVAVAYWALDYTWYSDKIVFYTSWPAHFLKKFTIAFCFGLILIPWAIIKLIWNSR